ncbi:MAG: hypothetical protein JJU03_08240 [Idiomarina sp.]|nr:hypothetical protein [Idiomarina sp.]
MKKYRFRIAVIALYLFLVASHLLLKFADTSRTWLQNRIVALEYESASIFEVVLGKNYIITPADIYYGSNPYYYTYFDALYFWFSVGGSQSFRACAMHSEVCYPGITYISESYSEEFFNYFLKDISINPDSSFTHYCINGIQAIGK